MNEWSGVVACGHLMDLRYPAGVVQDPLGQGGLARVDVSRDPDVSDPLVRNEARRAAPTTVD